MQRRTLLALGGGAVIVAAGAGYGAWRALSPADRFAACRPGATIGQADIGGPFTLISEDGRETTSAELIDKPTLLYFGYTFCPDVCPTDSARNVQALNLLEERGIEAQIAFVSVDWPRDTPETLATFTDYFHPRMIGLTGTKERIEAAVRAWRAFYRIPAERGDSYEVDHSAFTYLVLPDSGFATFFRRETTPGEIAETTACFVARA